MKEFFSQPYLHHAAVHRGLERVPVPVMGSNQCSSSAWCSGQCDLIMGALPRRKVGMTGALLYLYRLVGIGFA